MTSRWIMHLVNQNSKHRSLILSFLLLLFLLNHFPLIHIPVYLSNFDCILGEFIKQTLIFNSWNYLEANKRLSWPMLYCHLSTQNKYKKTQSLDFNTREIRYALSKPKTKSGPLSSTSYSYKIYNIKNQKKMYYWL